ncbi:DUF1569 domain-containing protein [Rheinheimera sp. F8]|uniref:DUF1569 domain-containing protein n=1 Tax=Rheinheimera sp. F8 TaxID=1763998 RepID=UPI00074482D7|nr:DUF1569 domain-containing protein [Rheinheimera sp. F8]ALZ77378.1 hypothetical protein ATY27_17505 [Rheinheimera sp. F8]
MNRRKFLLAGVAVAGVSTAGLYGAGSRFVADLATLQQELRQMTGKTLHSSGSWNVSQIFQHLTQSVRGSYQGYPQQRSWWFQHSIGPLALQGFKAAGAMRHPLDEAIPGTADLDAMLDPQVALATLLQALDEFAAATTLAPHFAYGTLSHADFQAAHQLHIRQHLSQIAVV